MKLLKSFAALVLLGSFFLCLGASAQTQVETPPAPVRPGGPPPDAPPPKDVPSGPYQVTVKTDPSLPTHTVYRPTDLSPFEGGKLPIVGWGNGGCIRVGRAHENFLIKIASHGFLVVAIGPDDVQLPDFSKLKPGEPLPPMPRSPASDILVGIDWAIAQNSLSGGPYADKIDTSAIAVMGQSCGGMQAIAVSGDPRVKTTMVWNSGVFSGTMPPQVESRMPRGEGQRVMPATKEDLGAFHAPVAYIIGGPTDVAYANAEDDFTRIEGVPLFYANLNVGHGGTFRHPNGGWFGEVGAEWLLWHLKGDEEARKMFDGPECGLCVESAWTIKRKNMN